MHQISHGIDEGDVVYSKEFKFSASDRFPIDYMDKQISMERKYLLPWLYKLISGEVNLEPCKSFPESNICNSSSFIDSLDRLGILPKTIPLYMDILTGHMEQKN